MKYNINIGRLGVIPLTLVLSVLLQAGAAVWWVSAKARDNYFLEQRVAAMEIVIAKDREQSVQINERLARIEERLKAQSVLLARIDRKIIGR